MRVRLGDREVVINERAGESSRSSAPADPRPAARTRPPLSGLDLPPRLSAVDPAQAEHAGVISGSAWIPESVSQAASGEVQVVSPDSAVNPLDAFRRAASPIDPTYLSAPSDRGRAIAAMIRQTAAVQAPPDPAGDEARQAERARLTQLGFNANNVKFGPLPPPEPLSPALLEALKKPPIDLDSLPHARNHLRPGKIIGVRG